MLETLLYDGAKYCNVQITVDSYCSNETNESGRTYGALKNNFTNFYKHNAPMELKKYNT